ncbi:TonB-dependent hemoglobin/transferrin/lactoferrin family receptor [Bradyrhizobium sp. LHD-71]|uniref:TonB-dependent hemoglobin/transferrin/lactoferrin family receptor n=1 Tax=Bradyrhizobium sp. LHD-71 TaxID=3072141 RepID=UPI00280FE165|nr:TonB-dependent hemoglobin/transferrin/lactoferrin family receptor [Bradyrhizobium sp. LHD-71]MDQ8730932.1 TonB-dependent hemoglobin/transferrin/lactoferrin family receptor [Bradyrhizobium sp. LHD-71]
MANGARGAHALLWGVSAIALCFSGVSEATAQAREPDAAQAAPSTQDTKQKNAKRSKKRQQIVAQAPDQSALNANAQAQGSVQSLDTITVAATKMEERAVDALAPVSVVTLEQIQRWQPNRVGDLLYNVPGVWLQDRGDDPATSINIRGLQDFGRVAVVVDGARQNYQRSGHSANGAFFLDPELISNIEVVRGPTANIYGSGAIGGVVSFRTKDIDDVVRPGERWGSDWGIMGGTNDMRGMVSGFGGVRVNPNVDLFAGGSWTTQSNYKDGMGVTVENSANKTGSAIAKATVRPADGHELKLGGIFQDFDYDNGQPRRALGLPFSQPGTGGNGTSIYATNVKNYQTSLGWRYQRPEDQIFDWDAKVYWNRTESDQVKIAHTATTPAFGTACARRGLPGNAISGCIGDWRSYLIDTIGFDAHNTSRFEHGSWRHALTYGGDIFQDDVSTADFSGNSNATTPGGRRTVSGAFAQWKVGYATWFDLISAVRYDNYHLSSANTTTEGDRFSPKVTFALLPTYVVTPYVSYAEGYRAPSVTETLVDGAHVASGPGQGDTSVCADGSRGFFCFLPNPHLRPEVGKNKEIGLNVKKDDLFTAGDTLRAKFNVFRNDVSDFIDGVQFAGPPGRNLYFQYQNIAHARIEGFEAEVFYDANLWFVGVSATIQRGENVQTGIGLVTVQPRKITTTAGVRMFENQLTLAMQWTSVEANTDIPATYLAGTSYDLLNAYLTYKPHRDITVNFSVDNILDEYYRPYAVPRAADFTSTQNDVLWSSAAPGRVFKLGARFHFGGA